MGMSASQARFLQLTSRMNAIGTENMRLSNDKISLARDMQRISREYQSALSQKVLKWTNNSGVTYNDITYNNLMKPSTMNQYQAYILTNSNDKVVIDSSYEKYAKMISEDGTPGNYAEVRDTIIAELLNIEGFDVYNAQRAAALDNYKKAKALYDEKYAEKPILKTCNNLDALWKTYKCGEGDNNLYNFTINSQYTNGENYPEFLNNFYNSTNGGDEIAKAFGLDTTKNSEGNTKFQEAVKFTMDEVKKNKDRYRDGEGSNEGWNVAEILGLLVGQLKANFPELVDEENNLNYYTDPSQFEAYHTWENELAQCEAEVKTAQEVLNGFSQTYTAEQEKIIKFYDDIFSTIADKGWECILQSEGLFRDSYHRKC